MAVMVIDQPAAVEIMDQHHEQHEAQRGREPDAEIGPDRNLECPPQRFEEANVDRLARLHGLMPSLGAGSTGSPSLRISKWSSGPIASPVWPARPIRSPARTFSS